MSAVAGYEWWGNRERANAELEFLLGVYEWGGQLPLMEPKATLRATRRGVSCASVLKTG